MTLTPDQVALREAAMAALSGEWSVGETYADMYDDGPGAPETVIRGMKGEAGIAVCLDFGKNNPGLREANARHIAAANPAAILALLAQLEAATVPSVPEGWTIERISETKLRVSMACDASAVVKESDHATNIPAYVLYGLASDLAPKVQP